MGCFDFTYADNGENTRGRKGYLYLTDKFCEKTGLKSPLRIKGSNEYGMITPIIPNHPNTLEMDIYAIYAAMIYLEGFYQNNDKEEYESEIEYLETFIQMTADYRKYKSKVSEFDFEKYEICMENIRGIGVHYFFKHTIEISVPKTYHIPKIGNQKPKTVDCDEIFTGNLPLVLTRKHLPIQEINEPFYTTVRNWNFVTGSDPNQGFNITKNLYVPWEPYNKK